MSENEPDRIKGDLATVRQAMGLHLSFGPEMLVFGLLLAFSLILIRMALRSRERYCCLGLVVSTLLAGMLLPVFDQHYSYALANCFMAVGYLTGVAIQWVQLREAVPNHAAD